MDLGLVQELFNPAAQHTADEQQRIDHTRVVEGQHEPGCGPLDLESGVALLVGGGVGAVLPSRPRVEETEDDEEDTGTV
ncbi:DUF6191 domain-containing protein [Streptomyces sp. TR06-5]|uniref:DUF6191 domain-containing protein n=1 Tax=Streptomyces sp. TR06-5 TaxID=3385976 RepID=UPI00399F4944